jgi:hypothetical protein
MRCSRVLVFIPRARNSSRKLRGCMYVPGKWNWLMYTQAVRERALGDALSHNITDIYNESECVYLTFPKEESLLCDSIFLGHPARSPTYQIKSVTLHHDRNS